MSWLFGKSDEIIDKLPTHLIQLWHSVIVACDEKVKKVWGGSMGVREEVGYRDALAKRKSSRCQMQLEMCCIAVTLSTHCCFISLKLLKLTLWKVMFFAK